MAQVMIDERGMRGLEPQADHGHQDPVDEGQFAPRPGPGLRLTLMTTPVP